MTFTIPEYERDHICESIQAIAEAACTLVCKYPSEYKDPEDCRKRHCNACKLFEMVDELEEEINEL